jgi:prepilin-type N-terminal cleavage/methylation domain-containing protein
MKQRNSKGLTLVELMIVVAIIGILASVATPKFANMINKAKEATAKGNLGALRSAVMIYYSVEQFPAPTLSAVPSSGFIASVPAANIPFVDTDGDGSSDDSYSWPKNAATVVADFATAGTQNLSTDGWAYDYQDLEVWVELSSSSFDTNGKSIYLW